MTDDNHNSTAREYLAPKHVGDKLGLSLTAVYALIRSGDLPAVDVAPSRGSRGGRTYHSYRIHHSWLDEFVRQRTIRRAPTEPAAVVPRRRRRSETPAVSVREYLASRARPLS